MSNVIFNFPTIQAPRHARPGVDVQVSDLAGMVRSSDVESFIACQHSDSPFPNHWYVYAMGQPVDGQAAQCKGVVCIYADRPLALPSLDDVITLMQDIGFDGRLQVCAEPLPVEG